MENDSHFCECCGDNIRTEHHNLYSRIGYFIEVPLTRFGGTIRRGPFCQHCYMALEKKARINGDEMRERERYFKVFDFFEEIL